MAGVNASSTVAVASEDRIVSSDEELDTPLIAVDFDLLERNIAEMAALAAGHGVSLRPHAKTHKSPRIGRMQLEAGAVGLTVAKLGEAEVLVDQGGVTDILIAYPIVGEIKIRRLLDLLDRARVIVAADTYPAAVALSRAVSANDRTLEI
jgi:D-serine deaminase-like pyridoxal phosphate-dependent protein